MTEPPSLRLAVGADHRGGEALHRILPALVDRGYQLSHQGQCGSSACDYPDIALPVATAVAEGRAERGMLVCGTGIGMCITANKVSGVRAAVVHDQLTAEMSRRHNDANVLCLAAHLLGDRVAEQIVWTWLSTPFEGGRHARRVGKIRRIEQTRPPSPAENTHFSDQARAS